ncbi:hypothetical protein STEG23_032444 [Scotinomys teguina]
MQSESGIVADFEVGEEFHEEPKTYYELKSQPLKSRAETMIQSVKCLPHKYEDLSSISRAHMKTPGMVVGSYNSSTGEVETSLLARQSV